jgi:hypothetical protein
MRQAAGDPAPSTERTDTLTGLGSAGRIRNPRRARTPETFPRKRSAGVSA